MVKVTIIYFFLNKYYTQPGRPCKTARYEKLMEVLLPGKDLQNGALCWWRLTSFFCLKQMANTCSHIHPSSLHRLSPVVFSLENLQFAYQAAATHTQNTYFMKKDHTHWIHRWSYALTEDQSFILQFLYLISQTSGHAGTYLRKVFYLDLSNGDLSPQWSPTVLNYIKLWKLHLFFPLWLLFPAIL